MGGEAWNAVLRRIVRQEEARAREKLARRRLEALRQVALAAVPAATDSVNGEGRPSEDKTSGKDVDGEESSGSQALRTPIEGGESAPNGQEQAGDGLPVANPQEEPREEEEEEEDSDFLQKHLLSRTRARWECLEDAQQAQCVALNRRQTLFAVGERDGRVSIWDNVSLRVITRELDPTTISVPEPLGTDAGSSTADEQAGSIEGDAVGRTAEFKAAEDEEEEEEEEDEEEEDDADTIESSTGNDDASVEADDEDTASVEEGDASTEEEDERPVTELGEKQKAALSATDLSRVRNSLKAVTQVAWSCDSRWLLAGCEEKATRRSVLCVWDVQASTLVATFNFDGIINRISTHPRDPTLAIVCSYNAVPELLNLSTRTRVQLNAIPLENASLTISIPISSRHPALIVDAQYGASGDRIYAATTKATVAVLDVRTVECLHKVELNVLIQYLDMAVSRTETALLITSSKGIHEFTISPDNCTGCVSLTEKWLLSTGAVRAPWALCSFTGDEKFAIGVPVVRHRHVGENGLYTWDRSTGKVQHNSGVKDGVSALAWDTQRDSLLTASATGALYVFEEAFATTWPGSMYPAGFRLITDNEPHLEAFDVEDARERERSDKEFERSLSENREPIDLFNDELSSSKTLEGASAEPSAELALHAPHSWPVLPAIENELLYLPAIPIVQHAAKRHGHLFQDRDYLDEKHFGLGQSVFEPLKVAQPKKPKASGKSKKRKSGLVELEASGSASKSKSGKRSGGSSQKRRRR